MSKDKKLYILVAVLIPLTIAVVVMGLDWAKGFIMPTVVAITYGLIPTIWIVIVIRRARQIAKKSEAKRKYYTNKKHTNKKEKVIERTISLILLVYMVSSLVYRLVSGFSLWAILASILFILISSSNVFFLVATTDE